MSTHCVPTVSGLERNREKSQRALLLDEQRGGLLLHQLENVLQKGFGEVATTEVGDSGESQDLVHLHAVDDVVSHRVHDQGEQLIGALEQDGGSEVTDLLLLEVGGRNQRNDLHVAEVDFISEQVTRA